MTRGAIVIEERIRVPAEVFDLEKFRDWAHSPEFPESGRIAYIGGEIEVDMSPEEIESHNKLKTQLVIDLGHWIQEKDLGELLSDRALLVHTGAELGTEPDIMFSSWESLRTGRVEYAERVQGSRRYVEVIGSPDLVVEIVSEHSVRKDTVLLRDRYFRAGIAEYWIIDARGESVAFSLLARGEGEYVDVPAGDDGFKASRVLGNAFWIERTRSPVGGATYRLRVR